MAAYPGEGYKMSNYGLKTYSAEQIKLQWKKAVEREIKIGKYHSSNAAASSDKPALDTSMKINYFDSVKDYPEMQPYDQTFHFKKDYNPKLKRDDMKYTQGLDIFSEEKNRNVPVLSSSIYGRRPAIEELDRQHVRVALVAREFYRPRGVMPQKA